MAVLVVQHAAPEGPGRLAGALRRAGHRLEVRRTDLGEPVPRTAAGWDAVVVMGGPMGAWDDDEHPHLSDERALLADATDRGLPVLGICLGAQLLAVALGGRLHPKGPLELGWLPVTCTEAGRADPVIGTARGTFTPLHWHADTFTPPPGAMHLATSRATRVQAFRAGRASYGVLFHVEADAGHAAAMAAAFPGDVAAAGLTPADVAANPAAGDIAPIAEGILGSWTALIRPAPALGAEGR